MYAFFREKKCFKCDVYKLQPYTFFDSKCSIDMIFWKDSNENVIKIVCHEFKNQEAAGETRQIYDG